MSSASKKKKLISDKKRQTKLSRKFIKINSKQQPQVPVPDSGENSGATTNSEQQPKLFTIKIDIPKETVLTPTETDDGSRNVDTSSADTTGPSERQPTAAQAAKKEPETYSTPSSSTERKTKPPHKSSSSPCKQEPTSRSINSLSSGCSSGSSTSREGQTDSSSSSSLTDCGEDRDKSKSLDTEMMLNEISLSGVYSSISEDDQSEDRDEKRRQQETQQQLKQEWQQLIIQYMNLLRKDSECGSLRAGSPNGNNSPNSESGPSQTAQVEVEEMQTLNGKIRKLNCGVEMLKIKIGQQTVQTVEPVKSGKIQQNQSDNDVTDKKSGIIPEEATTTRKIKSIGPNGQYQMEQFVEPETRHESFEQLFAEVGRLNKRTIRFRTCFNRKGEFVEENYNQVELKLDRTEFNRLGQWTDKLGAVVDNLIKAVHISGPAIQYWLS